MPCLILFAADLSGSNSNSNAAFRYRNYTKTTCDENGGARERYAGSGISIEQTARVSASQYTR